ncbi:transmembrane protein 272-like [Clupea harengus]|uniref:Transmembrane protein 272-like n=1 Tax=Clupea harengus TaxID=7950 RepID=A0A6P8GZL1_CLUHA|nr:transmembrane protein 272-like [Clupea harengus]
MDDPDLWCVIWLHTAIGQKRCQIIGSLVPFLLITLGLIHLHNCPKEPMVPIYVIVGSAFFLVLQLFALCGHGTLCIIASIPILVFLFCWLIAGSVYVYGAFQPDYESRHSPEYCEKILYRAAFCCTNLAWACIVILGMYGLCKVCCPSWKVCYDKQREDDSEMGENPPPQDEN